MSELIQKNDSSATIRRKLLTGASALVLMTCVATASPAKAEDTDRPQIWVELGAQLSGLRDNAELFTPPFVALTPPPFSPPQNAEKPPRYGMDEFASLVFQPEGSDWNFSASINYGRAGGGKHVHHESYPPILSYYIINLRKNTIRYFPVYPDAARFTDAAVRRTENHTVLDFAAGKDVGLGLFGKEGSSSLNVGVRFAQFRSKSRANLAEDPDWHTGTNVYTLFGRLVFQKVYQYYHSFAGAFQANRSFSGVGPSLSWKASAVFAGNSQDGALTVDWGVNAALLFGRQKAKTQHQTSGRYSANNEYPIFHSHYERVSAPQTRSRSVTVPNIGGFAGISYNYSNAKLSLGYRADFFFGAIDGGIDAAKKEDRGFYGPYASISIGLGD